jgi:8-oxo-dGTP diphosphatase
MLEAAWQFRFCLRGHQHGELREETGVIANAVEVFAAVDAISANPDSTDACHFVLLAVLCEWVSGEPLADDDAPEARWFDMETLLSDETGKSLAIDTVAKKALARSRAL